MNHPHNQPVSSFVRTGLDGRVTGYTEVPLSLSPIAEALRFADLNTRSRLPTRDYRQVLRRPHSIAHPDASRNFVRGKAGMCRLARGVG